MGASPGLPLAYLDIDLAVMRDNLRIIRQNLAPATDLAAVLKANAYGIGMAPVAALYQAQGTKTYFIATPDEGLALRAMLGPGPEIAVLCGLIPGESGFYRENHLIPVLNSLDQLFEWQKQEQNSPAMLHIDTGMCRLGLDRAETARLLADLSLLDPVRLTALISHFACADERENPMTMRQKDDFERITAQILAKKPGIRRSLSNSAGIFASGRYHYDLVRPGAAVYGLNPTPDRANPMNRIIRLKARILQIRDAEKGESIGYGATCRLSGRRKVATVGLGYADGFLRSLSNSGTLYWQNQPCKILGRVSMDLVSVDVSGITGAAPVAGDYIDVFGPDQDPDRVAAQAGTIGYEILTSLGARYQRRYTGGA